MFTDSERDPIQWVGWIIFCAVSGYSCGNIWENWQLHSAYRQESLSITSRMEKLETQAQLARAPVRKLQRQRGQLLRRYREAKRALREREERSRYITVAVEERRMFLWSGEGDLLFTSGVAVGLGNKKGAGTWAQFQTPRGHHKVIYKRKDPMWIPPDWHYWETASLEKLEVSKLTAKEPIVLSDGSKIRVNKDLEIEKVFTEPGKEPEVYEAGIDIVEEGKMIIPPLGSPQRRYEDVLGTRFIGIGDGYGFHGTQHEWSIGTASSHGCLRMINEEIESLYPMVHTSMDVLIY